MKDEIQEIINKIVGATATATVSGGAGAAFEMWLMLKMAERLKAFPFSATLRDPQNKPLKAGDTFVLRGAPGRIGSGAACHVAFKWKTEMHEIHANTRFRGRSTETHEIDLAFIPETVASVLRTIHGGYPTGHPRLAIECKFKESIGSKDEARQLVARQFDMHFLDFHPYPTKGWKPLIWPESQTSSGHGDCGVSYKQSFGRCFNALCRIGPVTRPAGIYLRFNSISPYAGLRPGSSEISNFLDSVEHFLISNSPS
jgi:hypothetical protein